jgi:hypothetical protein
LFSIFSSSAISSRTFIVFSLAYHYKQKPGVLSTPGF